MWQAAREDIMTQARHRRTIEIPPAPPRTGRDLTHRQRQLTAQHGLVGWVRLPVKKMVLMKTVAKVGAKGIMGLTEQGGDECQIAAAGTPLGWNIKSM